MKKARGRPPVNPVDSLRTRVWFNSVKLASGLPSAYKIEMHLDYDMVRKRSTDVSRPRKWDSYEKGDVVPNDKPGDRNSIDQAEAHFPGTQKWFRSPIWGILKKEKRDRYYYESALQTLGNEILNILFDNEVTADLASYQIKAIDDGVIFNLYQQGTFEAFTAILLLVELSEVISSIELRGLTLHWYREMQKMHIPACHGYTSQFHLENIL